MCNSQKPDKEASESGSPRDKVAGPPVDRGYAWVIVAAASGVYGVHSAAFKLMGMVYVEMLDEYGANPAKTLWVISVAGMVILLSGPIVSTIQNRTSHRTTAAVGGLAMASGIILTGFMPVMEGTFFTWSIVQAFGKSCLSIPSLTCTEHYFKRHRGLAIGLTAAGGGVLSFILPYLLRVLFDTFSYSGALLLYGGVVLQVLVLAALMRPANYYSSADKTAAGGRRKCLECESSGNSQGAKCTVKMLTPAEASKSRPVIDESNGNESKVLSSLSEAMDASGIVYPNKAKKQPRWCDLSLLKNERMIAITLTMFFIGNATSIAGSLIPAYSDNIGVSRKVTSYLLGAAGFVEIFCRLLNGWLSDRRLLPPFAHLGLLAGITGAASILCPIVGGAVGVGFIIIAIGAAATSTFSVLPVVVRDLLGPENVSSAMGLQMFFRSSSFVISTYVAGSIRESTGSWEATFYYMGGNFMAACAVSVGFVLFMTFVQKPKPQDNQSSKAAP